MYKNLHIMFLSLLCLHIFVAADPWPGVQHQSTYANRNVTVFSSGTMNGSNSVVITHKNSGANADFDFGFKHAAIIGTIIAVGAFVIATEDAHHFFGNIKAFLYRICGQK